MNIILCVMFLLIGYGIGNAIRGYFHNETRKLYHDLIRKTNFMKDHEECFVGICDNCEECPFTDDMKSLIENL